MRQPHFVRKVPEKTKREGGCTLHFDGTVLLTLLHSYPKTLLRLLCATGNRCCRDGRKPGQTWQDPAPWRGEAVALVGEAADLLLLLHDARLQSTGTT